MGYLAFPRDFNKNFQKVHILDPNFQDENFCLFYSWILYMGSI